MTHPKTIKDGPGPYRLAAEELERHGTGLLAEHIASQVLSIDDKEHANQLAKSLS